MSPSNSTRLLYSGKKCFWKSNISIEVMLIEHSPAHVIEIIAYDHGMKCEAPHLYVNENVLLLKLDSNCCPGLQVNQQGLDRAKVEYIFDRIIVANNVPDSGIFVVGIKPSLNQRSEMEGLLINKPVELVAFASPFVQIFRTSAVAGTFNKLPLPIGFSAAGSGQESPRGENRGIAETTVWTADFRHSENVTTSSFKSTTSACEGCSSSDDDVVAHKAARTSLLPLSQLPSPKSITDLELAYGAPPRQLFSMKNSTSSPNLANSSSRTTGSPSNPRLVPGRGTAGPVVSQSARNVFHSSSIPRAAPQRRVSMSAPSSPYHSPIPSPRCDDVLTADSNELPPSPRVPGPILRALSGALNSLGLMNNSRSRSSTDVTDDEEEDIIGLSIDADEDSAIRKVSLSPKPNSLSPKAGKVTGIPPAHTRTIADTQSSILLTASALEARQASKKGHQRRHTYDHADVALPNCAADLEPGACAGIGGPQSARMKLLGMRDALDSLRFPWIGSTGGGGKNRISPAVSIASLDQLELEEHPFEA